MGLKKLNIDAPIWVRSADVKQNRDRIRITVNYGRWDPLTTKQVERREEVWERVTAKG